LVRRYAIQLVQVLQAETAADQRTYEAANHASHSAADTGRPAQSVLGRLVAAAFGFCAATRLCAARWWRSWWRRRGFRFISV
jgi:hypothetical protein